jgi:hypothetical protein
MTEQAWSKSLEISSEMTLSLKGEVIEAMARMRALRATVAQAAVVRKVRREVVM